jgi:peptide/nickel transport system permease protein
MQLGQFLQGIAKFNLGTSLYSQRPVVELLGERLPATMELALASILVALIIAFPLGIVAAVRRGTVWDRLATTLALIGASVPNFWLGPLLILVFSIGLGWFPVSGRTGWDSVVLPALTLGGAMAAILSRMVRAALLEVLGEDYIRTAKAKGLSPRQVVWRHALRNALLPIITVLALQLGTLLGGAVITEVVFSWPGIGQLVVESIQRRDYPVVQGCVLLISLIYVAVNMVTDFIYGWADPRVRLGNRE